MGKWIRVALVVLISLSVAAASAETLVINGRAVQLATLAKGGKSSPTNFALRSAEFVAPRVRIGEETYYPKAAEKFLVLHYTLHNPQKTERSAGWDTFDIMAVDATDTNREFSQQVGQESNSSKLDMYLKPAQKVDAYTFIVVPTQGEVPKLMIKSSDGLALRYDLRGKVKPLPAPIADPTDTTGSSALAEVPSQTGTYYPTGLSDVRLDAASYTNQGLHDIELSAGMRNLVLTVTVKNQSAEAQNVDWSKFNPKLRTEDGVNVAWNQEILYSTRGDTLDTELVPGQEIQARFFFEVRSDTNAKTFFLTEGQEGRCYAFDLSGVR